MCVHCNNLFKLSLQCLYDALVSMTYKGYAVQSMYCLPASSHTVEPLPLRMVTGNLWYRFPINSSSLIVQSPCILCMQVQKIWGFLFLPFVINALSTPISIASVDLISIPGPIVGRISFARFKSRCFTRFLSSSSSHQHLCKNTFR